VQAAECANASGTESYTILDPAIIERILKELDGESKIWSGMAAYQHFEPSGSVAAEQSERARPCCAVHEESPLSPGSCEHVRECRLVWRFGSLQNVSVGNDYHTLSDHIKGKRGGAVESGGAGRRQESSPLHFFRPRCSGWEDINR
jgi:hypothetical protein